MKVVHIESGLGNQMLSFCEYLALKKRNPNDDFYLETIVYDIPQCNETICQWNGFELDRIFHIQVPNIRTIIAPDDWDKLIKSITESEFWKRNWNYPVHFTKAFAKIGIELVNARGDFEDPNYPVVHIAGKKTIKDLIKNTRLYDCLRRYYRIWNREKLLADFNMMDELFIQSDKDLFTGQKLLFKYRNSNIEEIADDILHAFQFPELTNPKDISASNHIKNCNSVAIHARRGDLLTVNRACYEYGYFRRAVKYIRKRISNPEFFIFCDHGSVDWAKQNGHVLGLDFNKDKVFFVDWNDAASSYRDMQLMAMCKHQIITHSSFGWWGAWLNQNPDKITCSPDALTNTTHTF